MGGGGGGQGRAGPGRKRSTTRPRRTRLPFEPLRLDVEAEEKGPCAIRGGSGWRRDKSRGNGPGSKPRTSALLRRRPALVLGDVIAGDEFRRDQGGSLGRLLALKDLVA